MMPNSICSHKGGKSQNKRTQNSNTPDGARTTLLETRLGIEANGGARIINRVKYVPGRSVIKLARGIVVSIADLPPPDTTRWVASQKAAVSRVFLAGMIPLEEVLSRYSLSEEELESWVRSYLRGGPNSLRVKSIRERGK